MVTVDKVVDSQGQPRIWITESTFSPLCGLGASTRVVWKQIPWNASTQAVVAVAAHDLKQDEDGSTEREIPADIPDDHLEGMEESIQEDLGSDGWEGDVLFRQFDLEHTVN